MGNSCSAILAVHVGSSGLPFTAGWLQRKAPLLRRTRTRSPCKLKENQWEWPLWVLKDCLGTAMFSSWGRAQSPGTHAHLESLMVRDRKSQMKEDMEQHIWQSKDEKCQMTMFWAATFPELLKHPSILTLFSLSCLLSTISQEKWVPLL